MRETAVGGRPRDDIALCGALWRDRPKSTPGEVAGWLLELAAFLTPGVVGLLSAAW